MEGIDLSLEDNVLDSSKFVMGDEEETVEETVENNNDTEETPEEENPESVGDEENNQDEEPEPHNSAGDSSANNSFSSIANALRGDGFFECLDDDDFSNIEDADDFRAMFDKEVEKRVEERLTATEKNIKEALEAGIEPENIIKYTQMMEYLNTITDDDIEDESEKGEDLRKRLLYQSYINSGFSQEKAMKEVNKSIAAATDIEDAKEALTENINFYKNAYNEEIKSKKDNEKRLREEVLKQTQELEKTVLNTEEVFEGLKLDKATRNKIFDIISKPTVKGENGERITKLQEYQRKNPNEFLYKIGALYELTNGFKSIDNLVSKKVAKKQNENIRNLERTLKNQTVNFGEPHYIGNGTMRNANKENDRFVLI